MPIQLSISNAIKGQTLLGGSSFLNEYSFEFDGNTDFISLGASSTLELTNDFSVSVWIKDSAALNRGIICSGNRSGTSGWMLYRTSANKVAFAVYTVNNRVATSTTSINTGTWINVIATFEKNGTASQQVKIYVNGTFEGQSGWASAQTPTYGGTIYKQIGFPYNNTNNFQGLIDEVSVFDRLLSSTEISEISASVIDLNSYSPLSWYRMGDAATHNGREWELVDQGSGGNNGFSVTLPAPPTAPSTDVPT